MKKLYDIMTTLDIDLQADLPALLTAEGLQQFEEIQIGPSRDGKKISFFTYSNSIEKNKGNRFLSIYFQAQLYRIDYETSLKYIDIITDYLNNYDPENIGMVINEGVEVEAIAIAETLSTYSYFQLDFSEPLDSCD